MLHHAGEQGLLAELFAFYGAGGVKWARSSRSSASPWLKPAGLLRTSEDSDDFAVHAEGDAEELLGGEAGEPVEVGGVLFGYVVEEEGGVFTDAAAYGAVGEGDADGGDSGGGLGPELGFGVVDEPEGSVLGLGEVASEVGVEAHEVFQLVFAADAGGVLEDGSCDPVGGSEGVAGLPVWSWAIPVWYAGVGVGVGV